MDKETRETFWKAFADSPFVMMRLEGSVEHAEPMTALLDKDAHHEIWFFCKRDNRIANGGKAMGQIAAKGHDVFACLSGTLIEETDSAIRDKHWSNVVESWFPDGKNDPSVMMLRFEIADSEVWVSDMSVKGKVKLLAGKPIENEEAGEHAVGAV
ncbi:general stress protein [Novosphingobium sp. PC22D]|uniref:pyridoxamine 5'-phosphate oxidase family protein n=1 Tax=Novosphingobium sp. PC22D TaxID=1962403 RepID=UPI000BF103F0|nr:pyridoxamine 5'-phosphate oxidase family protein [Novosphingobium sp. PC22D]PEQ13881.1 general stress protein [Novosphingobium sp. PC22D]